MTTYRKLLFFALFLTFDLIMFGAFVRVTDAGLGCPDWPGCYGKASPLGAMPQIAAEQALRPQGPVTVFKAWVEMLHRYIAAGLGLVILILFAMAVRHAPGGRTMPWLAGFTAFWVILQGLFGMWTVTLKLQPAVVTAHLLGGMILFALLLAQAMPIANHPAVPPAAARLRGWVLVSIALIFVQIALGGWVSTNYATLACRDFPLCQGAWWPDMDFAAGFQVWRELGRTADGAALPFPALTAIHYVHRIGAFVVLAVVGGLALAIRGTFGLRRVGNGLLIVLAAQIGTGLTNIFLEWPLPAAVAHTGGATALLGLLLLVDYRVRQAAASAHAAARADLRMTGARAA
ncbi:MAG TPA: COX15/CtaA family protein [Burkholderiaceae bacterium]|nr:COX15/CtaA family protein [Burkholderiaceae bacterium]